MSVEHFAGGLQEGDIIVLKSDDICGDSIVTRFSPKRSVKIGGRKFFLSELINCSFGSRVVVPVNATEKPEESTTKLSHSGTNGNECTLVNSDWTPNVEKLLQKTEPFQAEEIEQLKKAGIVGDSLVSLLAQNSASFSKLSSFAQEKYLKRKRRKHLISVILLKPTCWLLCEWYLKKKPDAILRLTPLSLGMILRYANIVTHSKVLIHEDTLGLVSSSVAERAKQMINIIHIFQAENPPGFELMDLLPSLNEWKHSKHFIECPWHLLTHMDVKEERDEFPLTYGKQVEKVSVDETMEHAINFSRIERSKFYRPIQGQLKAFLKEGFTSLIIACREPTREKVMFLICQLQPSCPFVIYHYSLNYLTPLHRDLIACSFVIGVELIECSLLEHQIFTGRSHPIMSSFPSDGYLVTGIRVDSIFSRPHTATLLVVLLSIVSCLTWRSRETTDTSTNVIRGVLSSCLPLLVYGVLQFRDGCFQRPHPAVWRLVMGVSLLYLMFLVFLLFQKVEVARKILGCLDPVFAGHPLPDRSYGEDCRLLTPEHPSGLFANLVSAMDAFVVAHTLGWFVKALMIRDRVVLWVTSALFELLEYILKGMLPNFNECWWDSLLLDLFGCNLIGIELGLVACTVLNTKVYKWRGHISSSKLQLWHRMVGILGPTSFDTLQWPFFASLRYFFACSLVVLILEIADLNAFFLKAILWVQVGSPLNVYRILIIALQGFPSAREFYQFLIDTSCQRFGSQAWILTATLITEIFICIKFGPDIYQKPWREYFPRKTRLVVVGLISFYLLSAGYIAIVDWLHSVQRRKQATYVYHCKGEIESVSTCQK
eukprot:jgi/Galph1/2886/GphlegSOOS_G1586.1